jgi:Tfp pilus assembly protein FimT
MTDRAGRVPDSTGRRDEAGITLIEMLIYMALLAIVTALVASGIITGIKAQKTVNSVDNASTSAQVITESLQAGIGSGTNTYTLAAVGSDQLVRSRSISLGTSIPSTTPTPTASCVAWYFSTTYHELLTYASTSTAGSTPTLATTGLPSTAGWRVLSANVYPTSPATTVFTATSTSVLGVAFTVTAGSSSVRENTSYIVPTQTNTTATPTTC